MIGSIVASSASSDFHLWSDLGEVVLWGFGAGVGLAIAFSLAMRGWILGSAAQRDGRGGTAASQYALGAAFSVICVVAVGFALVTMLHR